MKRLISQACAIALVAGGLNLMPLNAAEGEAKGAVPARADENNPNSEVYRVTDVIGLPVKNDDGAQVGQIKDLVINGASREVLYAVVAMNDAKEKDVVYVMPWTVFQPYFGNGNAMQYTVLSVPQTVWMQAPYWANSQWRQAAYSQWGPKVNKYYSNHIQVNTSNAAKPKTVSANKPALSGDDKEDAAPSKTKPEAQPDKGDKPKSKGEATSPKDEPKSKPNPDPKTSDKPAVKDADAPAAKAPKTPVPKEVEQAKPKNLIPEPQKPKTPNIPK